MKIYKSARDIYFTPRHNELGGLKLSTGNKFGRDMIKKHYRAGLRKWAKRHKSYWR